MLPFIATRENLNLLISLYQFSFILRSILKLRKDNAKNTLENTGSYVSEKQGAKQNKNQILNEELRA